MLPPRGHLPHSLFPLRGGAGRGGRQWCECVPASDPGVANCNTFLTSCQLARGRTLNYLDRQAPARLIEMNLYELINADIDLPRCRGRAPPR